MSSLGCDLEMGRRSATFLGFVAVFFFLYKKYELERKSLVSSWGFLTFARLSEEELIFSVQNRRCMSGRHSFSTVNKSEYTVYFFTCRLE